MESKETTIEPSSVIPVKTPLKTPLKTIDAEKDVWRSTSIFELVGFGYSVWFIYRYLLLANTRQELTDAIAAWKNKVLG